MSPRTQQSLIQVETYIGYILLQQSVKQEIFKIKDKEVHLFTSSKKNSLVKDQNQNYCLFSQLDQVHTTLWEATKVHFRGKTHISTQKMKNKGPNSPFEKQEIEKQNAQ